jgi:hypothetical protein
MFLIPLLLLSLKEQRAVLFIIVLSFINFLEWPVMLSRGLIELLPITVLARTLVFALIALELYRKLASVAAGANVIQQKIEKPYGM